MSIGQDIINAALLRSQANRPEWSANNATELLGVLNRSLVLAFQIGHLVHPDRFMKGTTYVGSSGLWAPVAGSWPVVRIENASGQRVVVVPFADRNADYGAPRLYRAEATYYQTVGGTGDPTATETLTFYSLRWCPGVSAVDVAIDLLFPSQFDGLLIDEMAVYLAVKDSRTQEAALLAESRDRWLQLYVDYLRSEEMGAAARFTAPAFPSSQVATVSALFTGGGKAA